MKKVGCTVPFFNNKDHVCTQEEKAEEALQFYRNTNFEKYSHKCKKPCNYLKAYFSQTQSNPNAQNPKLGLKFGDDGIQVTRAYEAYGELSLFADIGGYVGMFLGLSFSQLTELTNYVFTRLFE